MKHPVFTVAVLVLTLFIGCGGDQQSASNMTTLTGVNDISWGETADSARAKLLAIQGVQVSDDSAGLACTGGSFAGFAVARWELSFLDGGQFWSARITFAEDSTQSVVGGLETKLAEMYGQPAEPRHWTFAVEGQTAMNSVLLVAVEGAPVEVQIAGNGYRASVEQSAKSSSSPVTE